MELKPAKEFTLDIPEPFDFNLTVKKPAGWSWATPSEIFEDGKLWSAIRLKSGKLLGVMMKAKGSGVLVRSYAKVLLDAEIPEIRERIKLGLGYYDDLDSFYALGKKDPLIRQLSKDLHGMRLGFPNGVFEMALLAICLQMAPTKRSNEMMDCLIQRYGEKADFDGRSVKFWPSPKRLARVKDRVLATECKLGYRAKYIAGVAKMIAGGFPDVLELREMKEEEVLSVLKRFPGVGDYSAQIISPQFGFPLDVWSARIFHEIIFGSTPSDPRGVIKKVTEVAEKRWGRFKGHVFVYVLHDLPNLQKRYGISRLV
jgi:3-methyladenine DNA glycosylase/8-oxoguanine DNA glycosylase